MPQKCNAPKKSPVYKIVKLMNYFIHPCPLLMVKKIFPSNNRPLKHLTTFKATHDILYIIVLSRAALKSPGPGTRKAYYIVGL